MRLHIVNGTQALLAAHTSTRPRHRSRSGRDLKATTGLMAFIVSLLEDPREAVTHIAVALDNPVRSFRNDIFADYRVASGMTPEVADQIGLAADAVAALGVKVWSMANLEANDALATAARRWRDEVEQVRLFSVDPVVGQCVRGDQVVQVNQRLLRVTTEREIHIRCGCGAARLPDWLALVGDSGHGIPGIPQFGARSAGALVAKFGGLEAIPADGGRWQVAKRHTSRLANSLRSRRPTAALYKRLATLAVDAPISNSLADLRWHGAYPEKLAALTRAHGIAPTLPRAWRWL